MDNKKLIEQLYDVLFEHDPEFIEATKKTDAMVTELMENIYEITEDEQDEISGGIFDIICEARRDSYTIGIKHAVRAVLRLLSD